MKPFNRYIMHDQVQDLVFSLDQARNPDSPRGLKGWLQLLGFGLAVASYILAIILTA